MEYEDLYALNYALNPEKALATPLQYSCLENLSDTEAW